MNENIKVKNVILRCGADSLMPLMLVYMLYLILHGHLSPGGGFQGGVLMVAVVTILYLGHGYETTARSLSANLLHGTEGFASIMYVALAMLGVSVGARFCQNILYMHGAVGDLYSTGTIFWMNLTVGIKVLTGVGSIALLMLGLVNQRTEQNEKG
jgi:multicomponent Na+:H+ antiporter subunit B